MGCQWLVVKRARPSKGGWRVCRPLAIDMASLGAKESRRQGREVHVM